MNSIAWLRWTARALGVVSALLLLAFVFGGREPLRFTGREGVAFLLFPVGVVAGFVIAWWRELAGGLVTVASLALFYVYMLASGEARLGPYFLLFALPGFLHVAGALIARRRDAASAQRQGQAGKGDDSAD